MGILNAYRSITSKDTHTASTTTTAAEVATIARSTITKQFTILSRMGYPGFRPSKGNTSRSTNRNAVLQFGSRTIIGSARSVKSVLAAFLDLTQAISDRST
jgi:hypothetical protein